MKTIANLILVSLLLFPILGSAQSININGDKDIYQSFDRINVLNGSQTDIHSSLQHLNNRLLSEYYMDIYNSVSNSSDKSIIVHFLNNNQEFISQDQESKEVSIEYIDSSKTFYNINTNTQDDVLVLKKSKPILKYFYQTPGKFFEINKDYFHLTVNPIVNIKLGKEKDTDSPIFHNLRGLELHGMIDNNVYFYTNILENQQLYNNYTEDWITDYDAIPGAGFYKSFQSGTIEKFHGWDYLNSQAYVGMKVSKRVNVEFGHGKHFIGNGVRSLLLSDVSNNYFYLKFNTKIWKFQYQNIFAELSALSAKDILGDKLLPKKYFAAHYLSYKPWKNLEVGLFETIVFNRENHFEFQYLNPIILYRTVEQLIGSPDNILIGVNANWNLWKTISLYGQLILDEFKLNELKDQSGWWANKYGLQLGLKYFNVLHINQLDLQLEFNVVRPYTYSHNRVIEGYNQSLSSYSNYNQPLAHPRGANFKELLLALKYRPIDKLVIKSQFMHTSYGEDNRDTNFGTNILKSNATREMPYGNEIGQGYATSIDMLSIDVTYELLQNYYIDLHYIYRDQKSDLSQKTIQTNYLGGGIRVNIAQLKYDY